MDAGAAAAPTKLFILLFTIIFSGIYYFVIVRVNHLPPDDRCVATQVNLCVVTQRSAQGLSASIFKI